MREYRTGEIVTLKSSCAGYLAGDRAKIISKKGAGYLVYVEGRKSHSSFAPLVWFGAQDFEEEKVPGKYEEGDYVKMVFVRPGTWNEKGLMDMYLGAILKVKTIDYSSGNVTFYNANPIWGFNIKEIERHAKKEEINENLSFVMGDYVVVDNLNGGLSGDLGAVGIISNIFEEGEETWYGLKDRTGFALRGGSFPATALRFAKFEELNEFSWGKTNLAGYRLEYLRDSDTVVAGCKDVDGDFIRKLIKYGKYLPMDEINIRGDRVTIYQLEEMLRGVDFNFSHK